MDRIHDDSPAARFALQILRNHPQISYGHAVSAAEYAGVPDLPRTVFFAAADRLGIPRDDRPVARDDRPVAGDTDAAAPASDLVASLEALRAEVGRTAEIRSALLAMRQVIRAALDQDAAEDGTAEDSITEDSISEDRRSAESIDDDTTVD